jgi:arylsulfatase A-like enzyme
VPLPTDRTLDGRDIWDVLTQGGQSPHQFIAWSEGPQLAIRQGKWKLVLNGVTHDGTSEGNKPLTGDDAVFLSDVEQDPGESRNLRHQFPEVTDQLQTVLQSWRKSVDSN